MTHHIQAANNKQSSHPSPTHPRDDDIKIHQKTRPKQISHHVIFWYLSHLINAHTDVSSNTRCLKTGLSFYLHPCIVFVSGDEPRESAHIYKAIDALLMCKDLPGSSLLAHVLSTEMGFYLHQCVVFASRDSPGDQGHRCSLNMQRLPRAITTRPCAKYRNGLLPTSLRCVCE